MQVIWAIAIEGVELLVGFYLLVCASQYLNDLTVCRDPLPILTSKVRYQRPPRLIRPNT